MRRIIATSIFLSLGYQIFGQEVDHGKSLAVTKEFVRKVFDMQLFDSIAKLTTLNKELTLARFKYSSAYFSIVIFQLGIHKKEIDYANLSFIPYLSLPPERRTLVYEKFTEGMPDNIDLSAIYAVYNNKTELVTYVEAKDGKVSGIKSYYSQGGAHYLHQFKMEDIDKKSSSIKLNSLRPSTVQINASSGEGLTIAKGFIKFTCDSLNDRDPAKATNNFLKFRQKLLYSDTLDTYTTYYMSEYLREKLTKFPAEELTITPFLSLSRKQKNGLVVKSEKLEGIYAIRHKKDVITYLFIEGDKIKYFLTLKNLAGKYVFVPYGYFKGEDY